MTAGVEGGSFDIASSTMPAASSSDPYSPCARPAFRAFCSGLGPSAQAVIAAPVERGNASQRSRTRRDSAPLPAPGRPKNT